MMIVNPSSLAIDHTSILPLLPDNQILSFLDFPNKASFFSMSKCDNEPMPNQHDGFTISNPTPQTRNDCKGFKSQPFGFKGSGLNAQSKKLVANSVIGLRDLRSNKDWLKKNEISAAAAILNLHENTVYRIMHEYEREDEFSGPRKKSVKCPVTDLDTEKQTLLYKVVTSYYKQNMVPYFAKIYEDFMREVNRVDAPQDSRVPAAQRPARISYQCSKWSFAKILKKNNYRYGKINERDAILFKRNQLGQRKRYLEIIRKYDDDSEWDVVYQDETWIDPYSRCGKGWVKKSYCDFSERRDFTFKDAKVSRGPRIIIMAVGGTNGFVPGTTVTYMVSKAKSQNTDYHGNINGKQFFKWMEKVVEALPRKTAIVIDNSPVHTVSTAPSTKTNKADMLAWMAEKVLVKSSGWELIPSDYGTFTLVRLKEVLKSIKDAYPQYRIDELIKEKGHVAIRLPPYQADLNPIEYVWSDVKRMTRERNINQNAQETLRIAKDVLARYTAEQWSRHIQHVKRVEDEYRVGDAEFEKTMQQNEDVEVNFADQSEDYSFDYSDGEIAV